MYFMDLPMIVGLACPNQRCCHASIHRKLPTYTGEKFESEEDAYNLVLMRVIKDALHELGHVFGLMHCIYYECNMNSHGGDL